MVVLRRAVVLDVAKAETVVVHVNGPDAGERDVGIRHRKPAELGIVIVDAIGADTMRTQIAQVDDAQDRFGHRERRDHDRDLQENGAQNAPFAAHGPATEVTARRSRSR